MGTEHWLIFVFAFIDMGLITVAILSENPFAEVPIPVALRYRYDAFIFFFLMFSRRVLHSYSPPLVLWSGISIALWWSGALALAINAPGIVTEFDLPGFGEMSFLHFLEAGSSAGLHRGHLARAGSAGRIARGGNSLVRGGALPADRPRERAR